MAQKLSKTTRMKNFRQRHLLVFLLLASAFALTSAYISQFVFGHQPCILCLYQRWPFFAVIALTSFSLIFFYSKKFQKTVIFLCLALLLINSAIAFYHSGVEQKIFNFGTCSSNVLENAQTIEELEKALLATKAVRCDAPSFLFLGLSMASWNFIYCLTLFALVVLVMRKLRSIQPKN